MNKKSARDLNRRYDFMAYGKVAMVCSSILIVLSLGSLATRGLTLGIDFTGGTLLELGYDREVDLDSVRTELTNAHFDDVVVQHYGTLHEILVQLPTGEEKEMSKISEQVLQTLRSNNSQTKIDLRRVEFVGPQVGDDLSTDGALAVLYALIGILMYVAFRFEFRFALAAVVALIHDVIITLGFFSLTGIQFDLTVLAAVLAVIGYSLNDTIVVFDRIRENFRHFRKGSALDFVNGSLNETLSRTLLTALTTMLVIIALFVFGGEVIHGFALAMMIGVSIGTYSSIYIASPLLLFTGVSQDDLLIPEKEGADS